jgi:hypothetical protein
VIEVGTLVIAALTLLVTMVCTVFVYLTWHENRQRPMLRLSVENGPAGHDSPTLAVVNNSSDPSKLQVVFGLRLHNDGTRGARNWRVCIGGREPGIAVHVSGSTRDARMIREDPTGRIAEVLAAASADVVAPGGATMVGGRNTLNFTGQPNTVYVDYSLDAEAMPTRSGTLRFQIDWANRTARVHVDPT